jgi:hypothetical protein
VSTKKLVICTIVLLLLFPASSFGYTVLGRFHEEPGRPYGPGDLAYDEATDVLWASDIVEKKIRKIDPNTGSVLTTLNVIYNELPLGLTYRNSYLWNSDQWALPDGLIHKVDPADGSSVHSITGLGGLTFDHRGWLWCTNWVVELSALDPDDGSILDTITLPGFDPDYDHTLGLAFDESTQTLWVSVVTNAWGIPGGGPQTNFLLHVTLDGTVLSTEIFDPDPALDGYQLVGLAFDNNNNILWANYSLFDRPPTFDDTYIYKLSPAAPSASQWAMTYGGAGEDYAHSIQKVSDGSYMVAGYTDSFGTGGDALIMKLGEEGNVLWQKHYGGSDMDYASSSQETPGGGYIVAGTTYSSDPGYGDAWVLKLDSDGNIQWQKTYGISQRDETAGLILQTLEGGYFLAGNAYTSSMGTYDFYTWVLKLDSGGNIEWQKAYGSGSRMNCTNSIQQTLDGGYILTGNIGAFSTHGTSDSWVLKLDSGGIIQWQRAYGDTDNDERAYSIRQTSDSGYIVAGEIFSPSTSQGDAWVFKLDAAGAMQWQKIYNIGNWEALYSIRETPEGGYIATGSSGGPSGWLLKLDSGGSVQTERTYSGLQGGSTLQQISDGGYIMTGFTRPYGPGDDADAMILKLDSNGNIPGCQMIGTSNTAVIDTDIDVTTPSVEETMPNVPAQTSTASVSDTNATVTEICYSEGEQNPVIDKIGNRMCYPGERIRIIGSGFGNTQGDSVLHINNLTFGPGHARIRSWSDTMIRFKVPFKNKPCNWFSHGDGQYRRRGVWVTVDGVDSNTKYIKVLKPVTCQ